MQLGNENKKKAKACGKNNMLCWIIGLSTLTLLIGFAFVGSAISSPRYEGRTTANFDGKHFFNPTLTDEGRVTDLIKWMFTRKPGEWKAPVDQAAQTMPRPPAQVACCELRATWINHSTVLIQMDGLNILTDPIWSDRASPVQFAGPRRAHPAGIDFEDLPRIDAVLISHNHYDHLDENTLRRLQQEHRPQFYTGLGNGAFLQTLGLKNTHDMDWWQTIDLNDDLKLTFVPAQHFSGRGAFDRNSTLWGGFVLESPAGNVYFAGDTGYSRYFKEIGERFSPIRLAILPIGAYRPQWFMAPMHISPEEAVRAHRDLNAQQSLAIHYRTFRLADDAQDEPAAELARALKQYDLPPESFWTLSFGEGRDVSASASVGAAAADYCLATPEAIKHYKETGTDCEGEPF